ncbi:MAG: nucleoside triphosphate pyrophosphohydrolase, partial [Treponema sp.]|nr:nucleoside triphosphate pyrophosphohydrolase [Treponema sp.]
MNGNEDTIKAYDRFLTVIKKLRAEGGCPWDREQTPLSMRGDLIEETFEAVDAISTDDAEHAKEELGDV